MPASRARSRTEGEPSSSQNLLTVRGFEPATGRYVYSVNPGFGSPLDLTTNRFDQFSAQLGIRVSAGGG
jgi:hypothetical protein